MRLEEFIRQYNLVGVRKNSTFLFNWLYNVYTKTYLPCIDIIYKESLAINKTKLTIFDVLIDDLSDNCKVRNKRVLELFMQIPWNRRKKYKNRYLEFGRIVWNSCINSIKKYPRFKEFKDIFYFDLRQVLNSMEYSFLVNTYGISNYIEDKIYLPHGCMVILHCDMDLMCSRNFDIKELRDMRVIFHLAQKVAHVGNMLNTYPKEILEKDLSSPIISLAIRKNIIDEELNLNDLQKIKNLEILFKNKVELYLEKIKKYENKIKSVNIKGFSNKLEKLFNAFINRKHYWE